jgi:hypothetical protein
MVKVIIDCNSDEDCNPGFKFNEVKGIIDFVETIISNGYSVIIYEVDK